MEKRVCQEVGVGKVGESEGIVCHAVVLPGDVTDGRVHMEVTGEEGDLAEEWADGHGSADAAPLYPDLCRGVFDLREYVRERGHARAEEGQLR